VAAPTPKCKFRTQAICRSCCGWLWLLIHPPFASPFLFLPPFPTLQSSRDVSHFRWSLDSDPVASRRVACQLEKLIGLRVSCHLRRGVHWSPVGLRELDELLKITVRRPWPLPGGFPFPVPEKGCLTRASRLPNVCSPCHVLLVPSSYCQIFPRNYHQTSVRVCQYTPNEIGGDDQKPNHMWPLVDF